MIRTMAQILDKGSKAEIHAAVETALSHSNESPFWAQKVLPLIDAILSVLVPLRDQKLLFTPEGHHVETLDAALILRWCDLYCLRSLAFTLQRSNTARSLQGTRCDAESAQTYQLLDLDILGSYLSSYMVNLENEMVDFPITHYNLHLGITDLVKKLL